MFEYQNFNFMEACDSLRAQLLYFIFEMSKNQSISLYIPLIEMYFELDFKSFEHKI